MLNTSRHEEEIKKILKEIFQSQIWIYLWFKWWTLTYFCYWLDRFSTDIDIDILDITKEQVIIDAMREILYRIWDIKNETIWKTLHRWIYRYDETGMNIKIEFNKRVWVNNTYEIKDIDWMNINCMKKESLFSNKLVALSERFKNRDLYDVNFFLKHDFPINEPIIQERTWKNLKEFLNELIVEIPKHYSKTSILAELWEILTDRQKIWMKNECLKETISLLDNKFINNTSMGSKVYFDFWEEWLDADVVLDYFKDK